jgi:hypothetical protein
LRQRRIQALPFTWGTPKTTTKGTALKDAGIVSTNAGAKEVVTAVEAVVLVVADVAARGVKLATIVVSLAISSRTVGHLVEAPKTSTLPTTLMMIPILWG